MKIIVHKADKRGGGDYGWLKTRYSFSFANWFDPARMGFGKLRVLNDDVIAPLGKFDTHHHDNFEIITIPLEGEVTHKDSMGNFGVVSVGQVQVMSAGTGVEHSEFNASPTQTLKLFQIWIEPKVYHAAPRYEQKTFDAVDREGSWQTLVSPDGDQGPLTIYQDAYLARASLQKGTTLPYKVRRNGSGVYVISIEGRIGVGGEELNFRDAVGISEAKEIAVTAHTNADVLLIEVPLQ